MPIQLVSNYSILITNSLNISNISIINRKVNILILIKDAK